MPDLLIHNARIWTGDASLPWADTALVRNGRFAFVGRSVDAAPPAGVTTIDAHGRLIVPGFTDGHAHLLNTGLAMSGVDLKGVPSLEEAVRRIEERARHTPAGAWVQGAGWDQNDWPSAAFPRRQDIDDAAGEHPVLLTHTSGHCVWVNSTALRAAGITAQSVSPTGGSIDVDEHGEPTGILRDNASALVERVVPRPTAQEREQALLAAITHAHSLGVTGAHAMNVGGGEWGALQALRNREELRLRVRAFLTAERVDSWIEQRVRTGDGDGMLRVGGVKFFADGALGSLTAWMFEPYAGTASTGLPLQPAEVLEQRVRDCLKAGLAPAIHAIGDRANREVLDILERTRGLSPDLPRRVEHAQLLDLADVPRFAALGVTASVQPIHATQDMHKVDREWRARGTGAYAFASLLRSGANLAFGSDTPVETMDPIAGLHAAVSRRRADGEPPRGWYPAERVTADEALRAYTAGCAAAVRETDVGKIAPGCHADFVVLSRDILSVDDVMQILEARVDVTVVAGNVVYERPDAA